MRAAKNKSSPEGAILRRLRTKSGITQEDLAHRVGVTTHTIWRLENGHTFNPRLDTLRAIAKALGVNVVALLIPKP
ncbi:MAG TPA: helix-turn-helix transcriptional regulator [Candidatus Dormibacteraeota bacterium]|nr:helix-turn-helix transcriptional regulator [Candidatus Dormibacteraeota bacterium]